MKRLGAVMAFGLALVACGDEPTAPLAIYAGEWNADDSFHAGTLGRDGNCLWIDDGQFRFTLAFASGVSWDDNTGTVTWVKQSMRVGDPAARVGGSAHPVAEVDWIRAPDPACATPFTWLVSDD